jgi:hypothetical protein
MTYGGRTFDIVAADAEQVIWNDGGVTASSTSHPAEGTRLDNLSSLSADYAGAFYRATYRLGGVERNFLHDDGSVNRYRLAATTATGQDAKVVRIPAYPQPAMAGRPYYTYLPPQ